MRWISPAVMDYWGRGKFHDPEPDRVLTYVRRLGPGSRAPRQVMPPSLASLPRMPVCEEAPEDLTHPLANAGVVPH